MTNKPKIGLLTTFYEFNSSYSLCSVVEAQLEALVKYGYETVLFVHDNFNDDAKIPIGVEIRKVVPRFLLVDYSAHQEVGVDLEKQAEKVYEVFKEHLKDIDIVIEHDLIFQGWFLPYGIAIHKLAADSKIRWFHWIHSNPRAMPQGLKYPHTLRYTLPANSKLVYLNNYYLIRAAESYNTFPKDVKIVYNALDPRLFLNLHPLVEKIINKYPLLEADFSQIYPVSTTRMVEGKQIKVLIDIFAKLKLQQRKVCLIIANAHANDKREKQVISEVLSYASQKGLSQNELVFTSLESPPIYELGVPREVISQVFQLTNLFIFPSTSENCSLILLEAMLSKNLLVLNDSVPPMREFAKENALYFKFGGWEESVKYDNWDGFTDDVAKIIISEFENNRALKAANDIKKNFNFDSIFKRSIEPLFWES